MWQPNDPEVARLRDNLVAEVARLSERIDELARVADERWSQTWAAHSERRTRTWQVALAVISGVVLPLASIGIIALIHLVTKH